MPFSETALKKLSNGQIKIGYVNTTVEESSFGPPVFGQGWALEILIFCLGTFAGGVAAGFLSEIGKDLYSNIKNFFGKERDAIFELRDKHKQIEHKPFCYAFVFRFPKYKVAIAYDIREDAEFERTIVHGEKLLVQAFEDAVKNLPEGYDFIEIDAEVDNKNNIAVGYKYRKSDDNYLWFNRFKELDIKELSKKKP